MTVSKDGVRQLLREYFEDYNTESRFIYDFGGEQFLIQESINRSEGVSKHVIITLFDEYMDSYNIKENFIYDMQNCHFLIALQTAEFKKLADNQTLISSKSANGYKKPFVIDSKTTNIFNDETSKLPFCHILDRFCIHADKSNNKEIGFVDCHGEYCDSACGFGEDEVLG